MMKSDEELIAEAVAAGKVRRFPVGAMSEWEELSYREKHSRMKFRSTERKMSPCAITIRQDR